MEGLIADMWCLAGHKMNRYDAKGERLFTMAEVFPDSRPGSCLLGLRTREGLTRKGMAEKLGIPRRHYSGMENGVRTIRLDMAKLISATVDISFQIFL
jgi:plasmid maintenance system antidote protein VapI